MTGIVTFIFAMLALAILGGAPAVAAFGFGHVLGLRIAGFGQAPDLAIDLAARLLRDVLLARDLVAEEDLVLVLAVGHVAKLIRQAPARHHHARKLCGLLDVGSS